jgi:pilus assembly protein FimV
MSVTMPRMMLMACLLSLCSLWPSVSSALGLGEIHLNSALNEPMNAEIDLIAATPEELTALRATLAGRDSFTRYGIDRPPFLSTLTFKVGKSKDGRDVLFVHSTDAIPEPFVTFLVEVNWARGRLMREYTVLLDPPVYTPGENASTTAPITAPTTAAPAAAAAAPAVTSPVANPPAPAPEETPATASTEAPAAATPAAAPHKRRRGSRTPAAPAADTGTAQAASPAVSSPAPLPEAAAAAAPGTVQVVRGDTLTKIARSLHADTPADVDKTMIAIYRSNPDAFGGNINILRSGAVLRVPNADEIAALNQKEAMGEVHRQMDAWRSAGGVGVAAAAPSGHLRLVTPSSGGGTSGASSADSTAASAEAQALKERVKDLEGQLAESKRLIDIRNAELSALQRKLGVTETPPAAAQPPVATPPPAAAKPSAAVPPTPAVQPPAELPPAASSAASPPPPSGTPLPAPEANSAAPVPPPVPHPAPVKKPAPAASGSWLDWVSDNLWLPGAILVAILVVLGFAAWRKRRQSPAGPSGDLSSFIEETHVTDMRADPASKLAAMRKGNSDSFVVEESGEHQAPDFAAESNRFGDTGELKSADDTLSSESAVNLDQGDPLAEADFHMAYGLYDQAADLVRIALEREPDRRDLRLKLLEIYFVWGNKDAFLQTAKGLEATRDRAPAGEWDKIVIMGKQICPDEPLFASAAGSGRGAGALVDLNLEGGENRVDIDLFGEPEGERSIDQPLAKEHEDTAATGESPDLHSRSSLDFTLDTPERGADESPTRDMPPRDEPTVEAEMMNFADSPTTESPVLKTQEMRQEMRDRISAKLPPKADQTAEVSIDDLGLELDQLEQTGSPSDKSIPQLAETDHPSDAPTMVAGLDERSRRMMEEAAKNSRDRDLTELERELEASFIADLDAHQEEIKTAVLGPESAPTVLMPRDSDTNSNATTRVKSSPEFSDIRDPERLDLDSTSKLRNINADSIDLDLDRLATALSTGDTREQPRAAEEVFSTEVFEASQRSRRVDLDVGEALNGSEHPTNKLQVKTDKLRPIDLPLSELEPVTMSEVGTKLDLARAYMDMGDPEGARSILEEVVQEGSASQKQEASRLIESLPG